jgi:hypothetical protein
VTRYRAAIRLMDSPLRAVWVHTATFGVGRGAGAVFTPGVFAEPQ